MTASAQQRLPSLRLDIVIYRRGPYWVAHCLQFDLVTSSPNREDVEDDIVRITKAQIRFAVANGCVPNIFRPCDPELSTMVLKALTMDGPGLALEFDRQRIETEASCGTGMEFNLFRERQAA